MPLWLIPAVAGAAAAAYGLATQEESGSYSAGDGSRSLDPHQIHQQLTSGPGTGPLQEGQQAANSLKGTFRDRVQQMEDLAKKMDQSWQGDSAEAAKVGARPLKDWLLDSEYKLDDSDRAMGWQAEAFTSAASKVQPVPAKPPESNILNDLVPGETDTDRAIKDYNTKAQANVDAFNAYYEATTANSRTIPQYTTLEGEVGEVEVDENAGKGGPDDGSGSGTGPAPAGMPGGTSGSGPGPAGSTGFSAPGGGSYTPAASGGAESVSGSGGYTSPGTSGGTDGSTHRPGQWDDGTSASGWAPPKTNVPDLDGGGSAFGPGGGSGFGGSGAGFGGAGGGAGAVGAVGAVGGYGAAGGYGAGGYGAAGGAGAPGAGASTGAANPAAGPGSGAGSGAAGRTAMGGAAAAGGARGMGGMPMGAAGGAGRGGQGSEDEEHETKYLLKEDGDSLFGSDEMTAPPVIGE